MGGGYAEVWVRLVGHAPLEHADSSVVGGRTDPDLRRTRHCHLGRASIGVAHCAARLRRVPARGRDRGGVAAGFEATFRDAAQGKTRPARQVGAGLPVLAAQRCAGRCHHIEALPSYPIMKTLLCLVSGLGVLFTTGCVGAPQASAESVPVVVAPPAAQPGSLDELVAPIALYPDALVALILPASTVSSDVVLAARYLASNADRTQIDSQPWDTSVKGLARYPDVIAWMDENLEWTQRLGEAYLDSSQEVMAAIQRDRARAQASGLLTNTEQQQVVIEDGYIRIIPAQTDVIYVPRYDPEIVYVERPIYYGPDPWITFGIGFGVGSWLAYDCDWHSRRIWIDHHRHRWHDRGRHDWRHPRFPNRPGHVHNPDWEPWKPKPGRVAPPHRRHFDPGHRNLPRPVPIAGAPRFDREHRRPRIDREDRRDLAGPRPDRRADRQPVPEQVRRERRRPEPGEVATRTAPPQVRRPDRLQPSAPVPATAENVPPVNRSNPIEHRPPTLREPNARQDRRDHDESRRVWRAPSGGRPDGTAPAPRLQARPANAERADRPSMQHRPPPQHVGPAVRQEAPRVQASPRVTMPAAAPQVRSAPPPQMRSAPAPAMRSAPPPAARVPESRPAPAPAPRQERVESRTESSGSRHQGGGQQGRGSARGDRDR